MKELKTYLVTGGAGFIGSNFILYTHKLGTAKIVNLDLLTYAANPLNLQKLDGDSLYTFVHGDIGDAQLVRRLLEEYEPDAVVNFAAESHVDRSIHAPQNFIQTNIVGTFNLLESTTRYWEKLPAGKKERFRFLHVSTDEVYGSLDFDSPPFKETTPYAPNSPYSASKAASDHLVRAYHHTYGLPTLTTNCSNNYGPRQFPEKLIPLVILNAVEGKRLPIYGDGSNVRDWLFVEDHCEALLMVLERSRVGEVYNIGGGCEMKNLDVVKTICRLLDDIRPGSRHVPHDSLIEFVKDRPGHDKRYAINCRKIESEIGWRPKESFETGLRKTIEWYLHHEEWVRSVQTGAYRKWIEEHYGDH